MTHPQLFPQRCGVTLLPHWCEGWCEGWCCHSLFPPGRDLGFVLSSQNCSWTHLLTPKVSQVQLCKPLSLVLFKALWAILKMFPFSDGTQVHFCLSVSCSLQLNPSPCRSKRCWNTWGFPVAVPLTLTCLSDPTSWMFSGVTSIFLPTSHSPVCLQPIVLDLPCFPFCSQNVKQ